MDFWTRLYDMLWTIAEQLPSLITIAALMVLAAVRWKRHQKVSLIVLIALLLIIVHAFVFAAVYAWAPDLWLRNDYGNRQEAIRNVFILLGVAYHAALAVPFAMLLVAIFGMRGNPPDEVLVKSVAKAA